MLNEPKRKLTTQCLGDTIHMWAVHEALAKEAKIHFPNKPAPIMEMDRRYLRLFPGSLTQLKPASQTAITFDMGMPWVGPRNGQHVRDTFKQLLTMDKFDARQALTVSDQLVLKPYVVVCPTGSKNYKHWDKARWLEVIEYLRTDYHVIVNDDRIFGNLELPSGVQRRFDPLPVLASSLKHARAVVGVDSGHLHLADALGNPPVGLYGTTSTITYGPYIDSSHCIDVHRHAFVSSHDYNSAFHLGEGMDLITVDMVIQAIQQRLERRLCVTR